ncbi:tol-pal system protein YbgF [Undibacterium jejuense]|uniref:Cell division coordinator CpoB n=1 Tax=Undibacterium jejuense TaxID=1344949 RepID=A0A923HGC5_9BURK|nr:tol-pal system protein YbgF [Undibacterium jejuense]MBC3861903.1 tol-pal system protein YbgF [Undibacterium jejuense]
MKLTSFRTSILVAAMLSALAPGIASAGLFDDDEARKAILDLRAKLDAVNVRVDKTNDAKVDKSTALDLANENEQLRSEIAKLRGQIEVLANDIANTQRRQQDFYVDLDNRMRKLEPKRMTVDGKDAVVEVNEQRAFDNAMALFKDGDYKNAAPAFSSFMTAYPQSAYMGSAQYWLGNSYYAQRDCKSTISAMQQLVKTYPDHPKAPDAMLNIAGCYTELKEKVASKKTLETLISQYPGTEAAQAAKNRLSSLK